MPAVNRRPLRSALCRVVAVAALALPSYTQARPPDFPAPDAAKVSHVADSMTVGGRTMTVRAFVTDDSLEQVVEFYQDLWQEPPVRGAPGVAYEPDAIAPWHLLTRVEDDYVLTVQVQPIASGGAYGYLTTGRLPEPGKPPAPPPEPPSMQDSVVQSNITSEDPGKTAQTAMLSNESSLESNVDFYRSHYSGWRKDIDQAMGHGKLHALSFSRGRSQVIITIQSSGRGGSRIVVNSVEHELL